MVLLFVLPAAPSCPQAGVEWVVALYDFAGNSEGDLSFQQGDRILISQHIDSGWSCGHLDGREGIFPTAFVESTGMTEILQILAIKTLFCRLIFTLWTISECLPFELDLESILLDYMFYGSVSFNQAPSLLKTGLKPLLL